jgi:hypothetical protein
MRIQQLEVFSYDELSQAARVKVRDWYRTNAAEYGWWDMAYADFLGVCRQLGVELASKLVPMGRSGARQEVCIYFSGFASQGDGASFAGRYAHKPGSVEAIRKSYPEDPVLHTIARELLTLQSRHELKLEADIMTSGRYAHSGAMRIESNARPSVEKQLLDAFRTLADWLYRQLQSEYDYLTSDEVIEAVLLSMDYEFYSDGVLARNDKT